MMEHLTDTFVCFVFQLRPVDAILFINGTQLKNFWEPLWEVIHGICFVSLPCLGLKTKIIWRILENIADNLTESYVNFFGVGNVW